MRKSYIVIIALIAATIAAGGCTQSKKKTKVEYLTYTSPTGQFSVQVPKRYMNFTEKTESTQTWWGVKNIMTVQSPRVGIQFTISIMDMGNTKLEEKAAAARLAEYRDRLAADSTVKEINRGTANLDGAPALTIRYKKSITNDKNKNADVFLEVWMAFLGNRLYLLHVESSDEKRLDDPDIKQFFESFKYIGEKEDFGK